jgi:hypothetical protein
MLQNESNKERRMETESDSFYSFGTLTALTHADNKLLSLKTQIVEVKVETPSLAVREMVHAPDRV